MLRFGYKIGPSNIAHAGQGLFTQEFIPRGKIMIFPNEVQNLAAVDQLNHYSCIRWFENVYTLDLEWSPEAHMNHSQMPNCLWHLGFVFALQDLSAGTEITIDYRLLMGPEQKSDFSDSATGEYFYGFEFPEKMRRNANGLSQLFGN